MHSEMSCQSAFYGKSFVTLVAFERGLSTVHLLMYFQLTVRSESEVALVACIWFFPCMLPLHVHCQI